MFGIAWTTPDLYHIFNRNYYTSITLFGLLSVPFEVEIKQKLRNFWLFFFSYCGPPNISPTPTVPRGVKNGILFCVCLSRVQIKASRSLQCSILKNNKDKLIALSLYSSPKCPFLSSLFFKYIKKAVPPAAAVVVVLPSRCFVCFFTISLSTRCWFLCRDTHTQCVCPFVFFSLVIYI